MNDQMEERLRSYYGSLPSNPPTRLETDVSRAFDQAGKRQPSMRPAWRSTWRPAFGVMAAGAAVLIAALIFRGLGPAPATSPSAITGPSQSAIPTVSPSLETSQASPTPTAAPTPTFTPSPSPTPSPTLRPTSTPLRTEGSLARVSPMLPYLSGPAVRLQDGTALIEGGLTVSSNGVHAKTNQAEIFKAGAFQPVGSMADARYEHTATVLNDGRVLVVGGADLMDGIDNLATAEIYDPLTTKFTRTGSMAQGRADHTASLLVKGESAGRVLIAGGFGGGTLPLKSTELYDPVTGEFTATGSMTVARQDHTATLLPSGEILIAGGLDDNSNVLASAELYDPGTGTFHATGNMTTPRTKQTATALYDGTVLIAGGLGTDGITPLSSAEIYDPATRSFTATGSMGIARYSHTATQLAYGQVVVAGGQGTDSAEVYWVDTGKFGYERALLGQVSAAVTMSDRVLLTGDPPEMYCSWPASFSPCQ